MGRFNWKGSDDSDKPDPKSTPDKKNHVMAVDPQRIRTFLIKMEGYENQSIKSFLQE